MFFCLNRFYEYRKNPNNRIIYRYFLASLFVSLALAFYGIPSLFTNDNALISFCGSIGLILNAIGFSHFFLIPFYSWLSKITHFFIKYSLFIFITIIAIFIIINPQKSFVDDYGIIHWNFGFLGWIAAIHMSVAFILNVILLVGHFYRLKNFSLLNSVGLTSTFIIAGISGGYQYVGNDGVLLVITGAGLYIGIAIVFYTVIHGAMNRILNWQYHDGPDKIDHDKVT